jgi:hypothetical protein
MGEAFSPALAKKLARLIPLLGTDKDGEALATVRALERTLRTAGYDFHALAQVVAEPQTVVVYGERPAPPPESLLDIAKWCRTNHGGRLSAREEKFIADMLARLTWRCQPTEKQERWLRSIYLKLGGEP